MNVDIDMSPHSVRVSLHALPDEVLQHILYYLSPQDILLNVQCLSQRFNTLASEPLLWRYHCRMQFKYWDSKHRIRQKFSGNVGDVDWKLLYIYRKKIDSRTTEILDSILDGQTNRIEKFKMIGEFGYDAKDSLLKHCHTNAAADDVLARRYVQHALVLLFSNALPRYYASAVLDHVHRSKALGEWGRLAKGETISLERALGSFDLFVLHDQRGDLLEVCDYVEWIGPRSDF